MIKDSLDKMEQLLYQLIIYIISYCFYVVFAKIRYFNVNLKIEKIFIKIQNSFLKYVEGLLTPC
jgi:cell division protein FtsL